MIITNGLNIHAVVCPSLPPLIKGEISYSDPTLGVGSVATHSCDTGLFVNGTITRHCQNDGAWSGSASSCEGIDLHVA